MMVFTEWLLPLIEAYSGEQNTSRQVKKAENIRSPCAYVYIYILFVCLVCCFFFLSTWIQLVEDGCNFLSIIITKITT